LKTREKEKILEERDWEKEEGGEKEGRRVRPTLEEWSRKRRKKRRRRLTRVQVGDQL